MTLPLSSALVTARAPEAYSFCASMMNKTESEGEAVEAGTPRSWRNEETMVGVAADVETAKW